MKNKKTLEELVKEALETPPAIQIVKEIKGEDLDKLAELKGWKCEKPEGK